MEINRHKSHCPNYGYLMYLNPATTPKEYGKSAPSKFEHTGSQSSWFAATIFLNTRHNRHPDHYSESLSSLAADKYPGMKFVFPEKPCLLQFPGFSIEFIEMRHLGDAGTVPGNYCIVIRCAGKTLFFSGDCDPKDEDGVKRITGLNPDFSLLSFPWVTLFTGRKAVEALNPSHIAVAHLPLEKDDEFGYRDAARRSIEEYYPDAVMFQRFLQSAEFTI